MILSVAESPRRTRLYAMSLLHSLGLPLNELKFLKVKGPITCSSVLASCTEAFKSWSSWSSSHAKVRLAQKVLDHGELFEWIARQNDLVDKEDAAVLLHLTLDLLAKTIRGSNPINTIRVPMLRLAAELFDRTTCRDGDLLVMANKNARFALNEDYGKLLNKANYNGGQLPLNLSSLPSEICDNSPNQNNKLLLTMHQKLSGSDNRQLNQKHVLAELASAAAKGLLTSDESDCVKEEIKERLDSNTPLSKLLLFLAT